MNDELALIANATFVPTRLGLVVTGNPTVKEWGEFGSKIRAVDGAIQWLIGDWLNYGELHYGEKYKAAIEATGYEYQTLLNEKSLAKRFGFSLRKENVDWSFHALVQGLDDGLAMEMLDKAADNRWTWRELREAVRNINHSEPVPLLLIEGEYDVIYADPPWQYEQGTINPERTIEQKYPTMTLDDIKELKIPAAKDSALFLWTTAPKLKEALEVMEAWGFDYRTCAVWDKEDMGLGWWFRIQHELLLVGRKGKFPVPQESARPRSIIRQKRTKHSEKPTIIYRIIEDMYPEARKIELFARQQHPGWTAWGNEIDNIQQNLEDESIFESEEL